MARLGKWRGTIKKEAAAITGWGTAIFTTYDGDEVGLVAPSMRGLIRIWNRLSVLPFDKAKVTRVVYFKHKSLTTLRARERGTKDGK